MKLKLDWLWITWKQDGYGDFSTWVIQNHRVNEQVFIKGKKPNVEQHHLPKEISTKLLTENYKYDMVETYL